jgi:SAM-dependent methyltransferase
MGDILRPGEGQHRDIPRHERRALEKALRAVGDVRTVLDVGTGNGRWLSTLNAKKPRLLVGLDFSRAELLTSRAAGAGSESGNAPALVCADAGALPFPAQSFDLVVCLGIMPYVRRSGRLRALREMRRVTGRWVIVQYAHREGLGLAWQRLRRRVGLEYHFPRNHLSYEDLQSEMRRAGLGVRGVAQVGGRFSRSWVVLAEAPSPDWMKG